MRLIRNSDGKELLPGELVCVLATNEAYRIVTYYPPECDADLGLIHLTPHQPSGPSTGSRILYPTAIGARFEDHPHD